MTKQEQIEEMAKFMHYITRKKDKDCEKPKTKPSEIEILREALRLALSDKTYCRDCELNTSCGSEKCFKFRTDEVLKEAKKNLEEQR